MQVDYEVLPAVHSPFEAMKDDAPHVFDEEGTNLQAIRHVAAATRRARSQHPNT